MVLLNQTRTELSQPARSYRGIYIFWSCTNY